MSVGVHPTASGASICLRSSRPSDLAAVASYASEKRVRQGALIRAWDLGEDLVAVEAGTARIPPCSSQLAAAPLRQNC